MADNDLDTRALHDFLREAYPWHVIIGADDHLRALGPMLERFCPSIRPHLHLSAAFHALGTSSPPLSFASLLERCSLTLEIRQPSLHLRLSGLLLRLPDPSALAFLASPDLPRLADLIGLSRRHPHRPPADAAESRTPPPTPATHPRRPRVLVVDDHPVNRLLATELLRQRHFDPVPIDGGQAAIQAAKDGNVDFILMDIQMPEVSGLDATRAIREWEKVRGGHLPIIAVTAHAFAEDRDRCLAAGMDAYLPKPLRVDQLVAKLEELGRKLPPSVVAAAVNADPSRNPASLAVAPGATTVAAPLPSTPGFGDHVRLIRGDPTLVSTVAEVFLEQTPVILQAMEEAIRHRNASDLAFHAHRLKGSLSYLEVPSLEAAARGLERQGKADRWDQVPVWWEELQSGLAQLKIELSGLIRAHATSIATIPPGS
jgi:CheY-like chemotaxis protein